MDFLDYGKPLSTSKFLLYFSSKGQGVRVAMAIVYFLPGVCV